MSDLQLALIAVGAIVVTGVWVFNKWQERRHRRLAEEVFKGDQPDVLLAGDAGGTEPAPVGEREERLEPVLAPLTDTEDETLEPSGVAPAQSMTAPQTDDLLPTEMPSPPSEWADEIADCVVRLDFVDPLAAATLWSAQVLWTSHLTKTVSWLGLDEARHRWQRLGADDAGRYRVICGAFQLADRQGAVSDAELSVFIEGARQLAQQFAGVAEVPPQDEVLMHARGLDEFCASVDLQLGVNLVETDGRAFAGTKLRGLAEAMGLTLQADGSFHALDDEGRTQFTLSNLGDGGFSAEALKTLATHGLTLSLDVPRVTDGAAALERMLGVARQLTQGLGGQLVDAQRQPLSDSMIEGIRAKLGELQGKLATEQIPAGGVRALRLFS